MVGSRRSTNLLKNHLLKRDSSKEKKLNVAGPHYHMLPQIARRQLALSMPNRGHAPVKRTKWSAPAVQQIFLRIISSRGTHQNKRG
ncbi:hypothetical protein [Ignatzschineria cameli]|nr:hypothetical protein [Ignatzschineria cameli]PWD83764.1 hypothetical protein DC080_07780 [Ignatzschineria cameli]